MKLLNQVSIYTLSLFFAFSFAMNLSHHVIRKCCKKDEMLGKNFDCIKISGNVQNYNSSNVYWWLPETNIKAELERSVIMYNARPTCVASSMDILQSDGVEADFSFHLRDNDIRLDVLKESTLHDVNKARDDSLPSNTFCVDRGSPKDHVAVVHIVLVCPCSRVTCVRTCCLDGQVFNSSKNACETVDEGRWNAEGMEFWTPKTNNFQDYYRLEGRLPHCMKWTKHVMTKRSKVSQALLANDGSIQILESKEKLPSDGYCGIYNEANEEMIIFCLIVDTERITKSLVYGVCFLIGAICLLATVIITLILPEMRRNIHGRMALAHNFMLFIGYLSTGISNLEGKYMSVNSCTILSLVMQFSILAAFFWLNVMCIDISWTFSGLRPIQGTAMQRDRKKFIYYSLYAWGATALISIITITVEYATPVGTASKPNFCIRQVFFNNRTAELLFFFGPMALLLIGNLVLFAFTAYKIMTVTKETSILNAQDSSTNTKNKQTLILYVKLFSLMGVTWLTEVISWAVGGPSHNWYFTDAINLLRAVFIFVIFCCKRSVFNKLHDKVLRLFGKPVPPRDTLYGTRSNQSKSSWTRGTTVSTTSSANRKCSNPMPERKLSHLSEDSGPEDFHVNDPPTENI